MLVMRAQADVDADVVQQRGHLQQQPLAIAEAVFVAELVERARSASMATWRPCARSKRYFCAERLGAGEHLRARSPRRRVGRRLGRCRAARPPAARRRDTTTGCAPRLGERACRYTSSAGTSVSASTAGSRNRSTSCSSSRRSTWSQNARNAVARNLARVASRSSFESCDAAKRTSPPIAMTCVTRSQRNLDADFLDDVGDVALEQATCRSWLCRLRSSCWRIRTAPSAYTPDRLGWPRRSSVRLVLPPPTSTSSVHAPLNAGWPPSALPDGQIDEPALFRFVDDLERDAGAAADAIEEHVAVARLAHRAGRDRPDLRRRRSRR